MKTLHLLRHAKSSWDESGLPDFDRPLARRGRKACKTIAAHIDAQGIAPEFILCSPARRTRDTLAGILDALPPDAEIQRPEQLYGASAGEILALVNALPEEVGEALFICHNPGIQHAAIQLCGPCEERDRAALHFPTAALATIGFELARWQDVVPGSGRMTGFARPREIELGMMDISE